MLKKIISKEEFFLDKEGQISGTGGVPRGLYTRIDFGTGVVWYDRKMQDVTYGWGDTLEEKYNSI